VNDDERTGIGRTGVDADRRRGEAAADAAGGAADGLLDDVLRRMTAVDDADAGRSASRVLLRVRTQAQPRAVPSLAAIPRLAWAVLAVCLLAGGVSWFAMRLTPSTSRPASSPSTAAHADATSEPARAASAPIAGSPSSSPSPSPALAPASAAGVQTAASRSAPLTVSNLPARADEGSHLPQVDPIAVASIDPEPFPSPAPLTMTPVKPETIEVSPIAVDPLTKPAQESGEP
jgi:hypothetical protein